MAKRKQLWNPDHIREKIHVAQLTKILEDNAKGLLKTELSSGRIRSIEILLDRCVPKLISSENKTEVTHKTIVRVPEKSSSAEIWQQQHAKLGQTLQ